MTPRQAIIILNMIPGVGPMKLRYLSSVFPTPELILQAPQSMLAQIPGIGDALARKIAMWRDITNIDLELELAEKAGVNIITYMDSEYPESLRHLPSPPQVLYYRGNWLESDSERSIAIVGTRMATHYGRLCAKTIAQELAQAGVTVISGLARGIDTEAHLGALDANGRTLAIIGAGFNRLYPEDNMALAHRIEQGHGAVISEFPMNMPPSRTTFPMRNRLVAAWSNATLVIEAPNKSGALITARMAGDMGKNIFCVPGPVNRHASDGCHELIRNGSILATCAQDILQDMGWQNPVSELPLFDNSGCSFSVVSKSVKPALTDEEEQLLHAIKLGFNSLDALCSATGAPIFQLTPLLSKMQIQGRISADAGGFFHINEK